MIRVVLFTLNEFDLLIVGLLCLLILDDGSGFCHCFTGQSVHKDVWLQLHVALRYAKPHNLLLSQQCLSTTTGLLGIFKRALDPLTYS